MIVIKRDGKKVPFIKGKITAAIIKAFYEVDSEIKTESSKIAITSNNSTKKKFLWRKFKILLKKN